MAVTDRHRETKIPGAVGPRTPEDISTQKMGKVTRALRLTRWGMVWERGARAFWPLATLLALLFACFALDLVAMVPVGVLPWLAGFALMAVIAVAIRGGLRFRRVRPAEALNRLDRTLPGRPLAALSDRAAIGGEGALWRAHLAQMQAAAQGARAVPPDADLARRDPFALRLVGLVALVMAIIFGGMAEMGRGVSALAATVSRPTPPQVIPSGPAWEGWAEPPAYTRRPTIYLNSLPEGEKLELPKGTAFSFRIYSEGATVTQDIGSATGDDPLAPAFRAEKSGVIEVADRSFDVTVQPDLPPVVRAGAAPVRRADGRMVQTYEAEDDHGIVSGQAQIELDMASVDRRYGLAIDPEARDPIELQLPLPRGDRHQIKGQLAQDLSRHPWANLPVKLTLQATDGIEQVAHSEPMQAILPGRRFFQPLAATLIEMRRDLLWSRENSGRTAEILRAVTWEPEGFVDQPLYMQLRGAVSILESGELSPKARDEMAEALWQAAVQLEDGGLSDALERMKQAQEKLSEAIRNGASPDEIQRLMEELKEATQAYTQMLAEQGKQDPNERFTRNQPTQEITGDQIQQMMDEIQRLMNEGRMAEAQELLEQFNRMMENLQIRQGQGNGEGQEGQFGNEPMDRLADTLREQQRLSDEAFRDMQEQFGQGQPGQQQGQSGQGQQGQGQPGQGQQGQGQEGQSGGGSLADRQQQLREELGRQRGLLPGQGSENGERAGDELDRAGRAMEEAEQALRDGDTAGAMQRQADAIQSMREGMRALGRMLSPEQQAQQDQQGEEGQEGQQSGDGQQGGPRQGSLQSQRALDPDLDPLGRQRRDEGEGGGNRTGVGDELGGDTLGDPSARARDLLDEIRRRSAQRDRSDEERDYLGRLLDRF